MPFVWSVSAGSLPGGLTLTPSTNTRSVTLSGAPTDAETSNFSVTVEGHGGHVSAVAYTLTIQAQGGGHVVDLTWNAGAENILGYNVYRGTTHGGPYSQIASSISSTFYNDANVVDGTTYYYVTTETNNEGEESGYSNETEAQIPSQ